MRWGTPGAPGLGTLGMTDKQVHKHEKKKKNFATGPTSKVQTPTIIKGGWGAPRPTPRSAQSDPPQVLWGKVGWGVGGSPVDLRGPAGPRSEKFGQFLVKFLHIFCWGQR